ncbi:MAG: LD-carboxypeptidase [Bacteroidales bacterium]|nr:LD-carboxypeptidase [Bacteroidales bacterium]MDD3667118.1 LD-carboxypeptidase [Bacteroidales bacterium]
MKTPFPLSPADLIHVVAPSGKVSPVNVDSAIKLLRYQGFRISVGSSLYEETGPFAGTDEQRIADLQEALDDTTCRAILMARGGYGLIRIIDKLDFSRFLKNPRWIAGFSDITVLHNHLHNLGVETLHGVMPNSFPLDCEPDEPVESLLEVLRGHAPSFTIPWHPLNRPGKAQATITGGNLTLLTALLGSESETVTAGKILFVEDVGEHLYRIDRMMHTLKRAGKLDKLKGLVVGHFNNMFDGASPFGMTAEEIVADAVAGYDFPVLFGFPAGHQPRNLTFILGRQTTLEVIQEQPALFQQKHH